LKASEARFIGKPIDAHQRGCAHYLRAGVFISTKTTSWGCLPHISLQCRSQNSGFSLGASPAALGLNHLLPRRFKKKLVDMPDRGAVKQ
jgi:hypothetical protein